MLFVEERRSEVKVENTEPEPMNFSPETIKVLHDALLSAGLIDHDGNLI